MNLAAPFLSELNRLEVDTDTVLAPFGFGSQTVTSSDIFVPAPVMYDIIQALAEAAGDPYLGVHIGEKLSPWDWPSISRALTASSSIGSFLQRYTVEASRDGSSIRYSIETSGSRTTFRQKRRADGKRAAGQIDGFGIAFMISILRRAVGEAWAGGQVIAHLDQPEVIPPRYQGIKVARGELMELALTFPSEWTLLPMQLESAKERQHFGGPGEQLPESVSDALRHVLKAHLHEPDLNIDRIAHLCGLNKRTLSRRLANAGTTVKHELSVQRQAAAEQALKNSRVPISDIATRVGYPNATVFSRAFKRWTGKTPSEFRREQRIKR